MPSRKRAKGRERKGRAHKTKTAGGGVDAGGSGDDAAKESILDTFGALSIEENATSVKCNHGFPPRPAVFNKIISLFENEARKCFAKNAAPGDVFANVNQILMNSEISFEWKDDNNMELLAAQFVSSGMEYLIEGGGRSSKFMALAMAMYSIQFEGPPTPESVGLLRDFAECGRNIECSERDLVRFYAKRARCSCLKDAYKRLKTQHTNYGICKQCKRTDVRKKLSICSKCHCVLYCSVDCQRQDWANHKKECKYLAEALEKAKA